MRRQHRGGMRERQKTRVIRCCTITHGSEWCRRGSPLQTMPDEGGCLSNRQRRLPLARSMLNWSGETMSAFALAMWLGCCVKGNMARPLGLLDTSTYYNDHHHAGRFLSESCRSCCLRTTADAKQFIGIGKAASMTMPSLLRLRGGDFSGVAVFGNLPEPALKSRRHLNLQLWTAARKGQDELLEPLVAAGAQLNASFYPDNECIRRTALHFATLGGHLSTVEELARLGCDMMAADEGECIALHLAAVQGNMEMVRLLLILGCDVRSIDHMAKTAAMLAKEAGKTEVAEWLEEQEEQAKEREQATVMQWEETEEENSLSDHGTGAPFGQGVRDAWDGIRRTMRKHDDGEEDRLIDEEIKHYRRELKDWI